jgi:hypothetical protein
LYCEYFATDLFTKSKSGIQQRSESARNVILGGHFPISCMNQVYMCTELASSGFLDLSFLFLNTLCCALQSFVVHTGYDFLFLGFLFPFFLNFPASYFSLVGPVAQSV